MTTPNVRCTCTGTCHPDTARAQCVAELETAGWPSVAEDISEGSSSDTVLRRLREIGEGYSEAAEIVAEADLPST